MCLNVSSLKMPVETAKLFSLSPRFTRSSYPTDIPVWILDKSFELLSDWISFDEPVRPGWEVCDVGSWWNVHRRNPRLKNLCQSIFEDLAAKNSQEWVEGYSSIEMTIVSVDVSLDLSVSQAVSVDVSMGDYLLFFLVRTIGRGEDEEKRKRGTLTKPFR